MTGFYASPSKLVRQLSAAVKDADLSDLEQLYGAEDKTVATWLEAAADALAPVFVYTEYLLDLEAVIFYRCYLTR